MRKGFYFFLLISLIILSKPCVEKGLGFYLQWKAKVDFHLDLSFRSLLIKGTRIEIKRLTFAKEEIEGFVDEANFYFHFDFSKFTFFPELGLKKPKIYLKKPLAFKSKAYGKRLPFSIKDGKLFVGDIKVPLTFSYRSGNKSFEGFLEEGKAFAKIDDERVIFSFEKISLSGLLPFAKFFSYVEPTLLLEGVGDGSIIFPFSSEKLFADLHLRDFVCKKNDLLLHTKSLSFKIRGYYDLEKSIWENNKKFNTFLSLSDAKISSQNNPWEINSLKGFFFLDSLEKFQSEFSAIAENGEKTIPLLLEGKKGNAVTCHLDFLKTRLSEEARASFMQGDSSFIFEIQKMCPEKKKIFDLILSEIFPNENVELQKGIIDTKFECKLEDGKLKQICLHHLKGGDLFLQKDEIKASIGKVSVEGVFNISENLLTDAIIKLTEGKVIYKDLQMNPLSIDLSIKNKNFQPSKASCTLNGVDTSLKFEGKLPFFTTNIDIDGDVAALYREIYLKNKNPTNLELSGELLQKYLSKIHLNISKKEEGIFYTAQMDSSKDRVMVFAKTKDFVYRPTSLWEKLQFFECECEYFDLSSLNAFFPDKVFSGTVMGNIDWEEEDFSIKMNLDRFEMKNHLFSLQFNEKIVLNQGRFSPVSEKITFSFPFYKAAFYLNNPDLQFQDIGGTLFFDDRLFTFDIKNATGEGFDLKGKAFFDPRGRVDLDFNQLNGSFSKTLGILEKLDIPSSAFEKIEGMLHANSCVYSFVSQDVPTSYFSISGDLKNIKGRLTDKVGFQGLNGLFSFDTNSEKLCFTDITTFLNIEGEEDLSVRLDSFTRKKDELTFDLFIDQSFVELAHLKGSALAHEGLYCYFGDESHLYGDNLKDFSCKFVNNWFQEFSLISSQKITKKKMQLLQNIFGLKASLPLDANVELSISYNSDAGKVSLTGNDLTFFDHHFDSLNVQLEKEAGNWKVHKGLLDDIHFEGTLKNRYLDFQLNYLDQSSFRLCSEIEDLERWKIDSFKIYHKKPGLFLAGKGNVFIDLFQDHPFSIDCDLTLVDKARVGQYNFTNTTPLNMKFSIKEQLLIGGIDFLVSAKNSKEPTHIKTKLVQVDLLKKELKSDKVALSIPSEFHFGKELFNKDLGLVDLLVDIEANLNKVHLDIKKGFFQEDSNSEKKQFKQLQVSIDQNGLALDGRYLFDKTYIPFKADVYLEPELKGNLTLFDPGIKVVDPLSIYWHFDKEFVIDHLSGMFAGIDAEFCHRDSGSLIGRADIDFSKLSPYLDKRVKEFIVDGLEMKEGYFLKGTFTYNPQDLKPQSFSGHMTGKNFSFFGYQLQTLFSKVNWSNKGLFLDHLKMSDDGGMLHIDQLYFENKKKQTFVNIPKITFQDIRPSLLKGVGKEKKQEDFDPPDLDPLIIKTITIENIKGDIDDDRTITGKGSLDFINSFNRGKKSLFDLPSEVIGKIFGLDLELLIPVCGSLDFKIQDQKLLFTDLKDTYSENQRSQFFLFEKMSPYIDFNSNLHVYIKMKQFVLFKITEQLIISLSGSIYDPKIALENKKQFND